MRDFRHQIDDLPIEEKIALIDALWASLDGADEDLTEAQRAELDRRAAAYAQDPSDVAGWDQVKARLSGHD
jgi:putative addiction module component (TIGR02574 family)